MKIYNKYHIKAFRDFVILTLIAIILIVFIYVIFSHFETNIFESRDLEKTNGFMVPALVTFIIGGYAAFNYQRERKFLKQQQEHNFLINAELKRYEKLKEAMASLCSAEKIWLKTDTNRKKQIAEINKNISTIIMNLNLSERNDFCKFIIFVAEKIENAKLSTQDEVNELLNYVEVQEDQCIKILHKKFLKIKNKRYKKEKAGGNEEDES